jgi:hypothetical protein
VADKAMGLNGDLIVWSKATAIPVTLRVIPGSEDDKNLSILLDANRPARGKRPARDKVTLTIIYPDGRSQQLSPGAITDGPPVLSVSSAGRFKTRDYVFAFEGLSNG